MLGAVARPIPDRGWAGQPGPGPVRYGFNGSDSGPAPVPVAPLEDSPSPKFYFHCRTETEQLLEDHEGSTHADLEAAHDHANALGRAILEQALAGGADPCLPRSIEITDEAGKDQLFIVFWAALAPGDPAPGAPIRH